MKDKITYACQYSGGSFCLKVGPKLDYNSYLLLEIENWHSYHSVFLSPKQIKKLRKQLKKVLKT